MQKLKPKNSKTTARKCKIAAKKGINSDNLQLF